MSGTTSYISESKRAEMALELRLLNISTVKLARQAGYSESAVYNAIKGRIEMTLRMYNAIKSVMDEHKKNNPVQERIVMPKVENSIEINGVKYVKADDAGLRHAVENVINQLKIALEK